MNETLEMLDNMQDSIENLKDDIAELRRELDELRQVTDRDREDLEWRMEKAAMRVVVKGDMMPSFPTLTPAYGRDYKSKKAALADFDANKDFVYNDITSPWDGKYCNKENLIKAGGIKEVKIRYKRLTELCVVKL